jgi:hypothetical protein
LADALPGVTMILGGTMHQTVTTNDDGFYQFTNLPTGTYVITQVQSAACYDGADSAGTIDGATAGTAHNPGDRIDGIALPAAKSGVNYQFTETGLNPLFIPNRLLANTTQPVGSAAWRETIRNTMTRAEQQRVTFNSAAVTTASHVKSTVATTSQSAHLLVASKAAAAVVAPVSTARAVAPVSTRVQVSPSQPSPAAVVSPAVPAVPLTIDALQPIVNEAIADWADAGLSSANVDALRHVKFAIADLSGACLGLTEGNQVFIDRDAAGYGWFVDSTPVDDSEFANVLGPHTLAANGSPAAQRVDLLTTVMHEMGHVLGYNDDAAGDLMNSTLPLGVRRTSLVDEAFAAL